MITRRPSQEFLALRVLAAALLGTLLLGACSTSNLNFLADTRVKFHSPRTRQSVQLPVTMTWEATGLPVGVHFGVFVDRAPMKPGQGLSAVVDDQCRRTPGCPTKDDLASRGIYVTNGSSLSFDTLPNTNAGKHNQTKETQRIIIVYLDSQNHRVSESAFALEFFLKRQGGS